MRRRTMQIVGFALATLALVFAILVIVLKTSWGEDRARVLVERAVAQSIGGSGRLKMTSLGDFEMFSPFGVLRGTAEELRIIDPTGAEAVRIEEVTAELDLWSLFAREVNVPQLTISGAQIPIDVETGQPRVALPPARRTAFEPRWMDVQLENIELTGLYLIAPKRDGKRAIVGRLRAKLELAVPRDEPGVRGSIQSARGEISVPEAIRLHDATGEFDTSMAQAADIRFSADASGASVAGRLRYVPRDREEPLKVQIENFRSIDPSMLNIPLETLGGEGLPLDMLRETMSAPR